MDVVSLITIFILVFAGVMVMQGIFTLIWMLYAWEDPERVDANKSPRDLASPKISFTALIPARNEEGVIADTLSAVSKIDYPEDLKQTVVICRSDDVGTISITKETIEKLGKKNMRVVIFNDFPINKPRGLNEGLKVAKNDVVVVFDAEDEPHPDIYKIINTIMLKEDVDVVQSGIQLMNYQSPWFATLNVLEYFFWFKSALHLFARFGLIPLGGNSVFFKRDWLQKVGGWNEICLTEDADIGIKLSLLGAKTRVTYDEEHATQEETPPDISSFIRQRARWCQGYIQIFLKGEWLRLPTLGQKVLCAYLFLWPILQILMCIYIPISAVFIVFFKTEVAIALFSILPLYILLIQLSTLNIGLYEFARDYRLKYSVLTILKVFLTFYPYQIVVGLSVIRAVVRMAFGKNVWEKTLHINAHRKRVTGGSQLALETIES